MWIRRWTSSVSDQKKVNQFSIDLFDHAGMENRKRLKQSHADKYREAMRITQIIAGELADIDDDTIFRDAKIHSGSEKKQSKRPLTREQKKALKAEFSIKSSDEDDTSSDDGALHEDSGTSEQHTPHLTIRLNPIARKVGVPKKAKSKTVAVNNRIGNAEQGRKAAGEVTLHGLLEALDREKPSLAKTQRRLAGVLVKYTDENLKKPKFKGMKNPVLILDPFYLLPTKLLDVCKTRVLQRFHIPTQRRLLLQLTVLNPKILGKRQIKDVGVYSRSQIETFKSVGNLKTCVQLGVDMHIWLTEQGIPSLPAGYHDCGQKVANEIWTSYPHKRIDGLPDMSDFDYSMLYRATPPTWLTDASIRALCLSAPSS
ncbi:hypothetical protein PHMEG_00023884 [Phytophthora megakarya]|uniref:Uncharacterized protein n=1 Tax=Phytophthora megakarya TaxID=4795 RepID=A0A225VG00_9STRA|nr:hypothetical protein PHMEG_00023884 [Phytophthora megakarya]